MALLQHHGGPTRLLDFTHSLYVATFFAIEAADANAAVWAFDLNYLDRERNIAWGSALKDEINRKNVAEAEKVLDDAVNVEVPLGILHVEPERLNERMAIQQGVFLFPNSVRASFMDNVRSVISVAEEELPIREFIESADTFGDSPGLVKIMLPRAMHTDIIKDLRRMNVDAASLFPGLEGFARSLRTELRWG